MNDEAPVTREEMKRVIQDHIEKFARTVGLPYDPPNLFHGFSPKKRGWHYPNALTMARLSVLAYQSRTIVKSRLEDSGVTDSGFAWFEARKTDTQGFGCALPESLIFCFRGTESLRDAMLDLQKTRIPFEVNGEVRGKVHEGFNAALDSVWQDIEKFIASHGIGSRNVWLTGHSLGGAIAMLCAAKIAYIYEQGVVAGLHTFGQPRVGDRTFRTHTIEVIGSDNIFRIYRCADPVAMLPRVGYRHVTGVRCYISRSGEFHFNAPWRRRALERSLVWGLIIPKLLTSGGRLSVLKRLVSDHFSQGYLARLRDITDNALHTMGTQEGGGGHS